MNGWERILFFVSLFFRVEVRGRQRAAAPFPLPRPLSPLFLLSKGNAICLFLYQGKEYKLVGERIKAGGLFYFIKAQKRERKLRGTKKRWF